MYKLFACFKQRLLMNPYKLEIYILFKHKHVQRSQEWKMNLQINSSTNYKFKHFHLNQCTILQIYLAKI